MNPKILSVVTPPSIYHYVRIMVIMKLKLVNGKTLFDAASAANGTATDGYVDHGTAVIKEL